MKNRLFKYINRTMWVVIVMLLSYVLMKSSVIFSNSDIRQTMGNLGDSMMRQIGSQVITTNSPLLRYATSTTSNSNQENIFAKYIDQFFPLNHYSIEAFKDNVEEENKRYMINTDDWNEEDGVAYLSEEERRELELENESVQTISNQYTDEISFIRGETYLEDMSSLLNEESVYTLKSNQKIIERLRKDYDYDFFVKNFYIVSAETKATKALFNPKTLLSKDMSLKASNEKPQILIYHTHTLEAFSDSREGEAADTIVGVGEHLAKILREEYGYNVIHDTTPYETLEGSDRNKAYNFALTGITEILDKNPSIEVVIDLHRDGVLDNTKLVTNINGKKTARLMFFNGLSRNSTVSEAKNAMEPLASILSEVLEGK